MSLGPLSLLLLVPVWGSCSVELTFSHDRQKKKVMSSLATGSEVLVPVADGDCEASFLQR